MITSRIVYEDNLRTKVTHIRSGQQFVTDAPIDNQGRGQAISSTDMLATSLDSCMLTIMGIALSLHPDIKQTVRFHFL